MSISGVAGPGGGTEEKPVGLVYYGLAWQEDRVKGNKGEGVRVEAFQTCFTSVREVIRLFASHRALDLVRRRVLGLPLDLPKLLGR